MQVMFRDAIAQLRKMDYILGYPTKLGVINIIALVINFKMDAI